MKRTAMVLSILGFFLMGQGEGCDEDLDGDGWSVPDDCDDGDASVHPGADEVCDGVDNNCDGTIDEGCGVDYVGNYDAFADDSNHGANYLLGSPITLSSYATLVGVGLDSRSSGQLVTIGIYDSNSSGGPGNLLADVYDWSLTGDRMETSVTPVTLEPGTYWFMAVYNEDASVGVQYTGLAEVVYVGFGYGNELPSTFTTSVESYTGQEFNYYLMVEY